MRNMAHTVINKASHLLLAVLVALMLFPAAGPAYAAQYTTGRSDVSGFDVSSDGKTLTIDFSGNSWSFQGDYLAFSFSDGASITYTIQVTDGIAVKGPGWTDVAGVSGEVTRVRDAAHEWGSMYDATLSIPLSSLPGNGDFTMTFFGTSVTSAQMGVASSQGETGGSGSSSSSSSSSS